MKKHFRKIAKNLSANNCKVYARHLRVLNDPDQPAEGNNISPCGGLTKVTVVVPGRLINAHLQAADIEISGEARCGNTETFSRDEGMNTAFYRMLHNMRTMVGRDTMKRIVSTPPVTIVPDPSVPNEGYVNPDQPQQSKSRSLLALVS